MVPTEGAHPTPGAEIVADPGSGAAPASPAAIAPEGVRFGPDGLATAVVVDAASGQVLMVASMDAEALEATLRTGEVHFHSRSRGRLWRKGETSGNVLRLRSIAVDCDADALLLRADPAGPTCHRGTRSCFDPPPDGGDPAALAGAAETRPGTGPETGSPGDRQPDGGRPFPRRAEPATEAAFAWLAVLWDTIAERAASRPPGSYTAALLAGGPEAVGRKVVEEAVEVLLAAKDDAWREASGDGAAPEGAAPERAAPEGPRATTRAALAGEAADLLYHLLVLLAERSLPPDEVVAVLRRRHRP